MTIPTEAWIAINTIGLCVIAFFSYLSNRKVSEVKEIVDGPLSLALKSNAELARRVADTTGAQDDIIAAAKAEIVNANREAGKVASGNKLHKKQNPI